ncbi:MAG: hypothetical protein DRN66_00310 [Candidatus Nanohalarchaeota archaeon]|nr:MAG: hypothetical protein DRN66_00310 [Candidatus Nanohaloarchaeota archaeon]
MNNFETLIFLGILMGLIYLCDRKNFTKEAPLMYIRKIKKGLPFLEKYGSRHKKFFKTFGDMGIVFTFGITGLWYIFAEKKYKRWTDLLLVFLAIISFVFLIGIFEKPIASAVLTLVGASGVVFMMLLESAKAIITKKLTTPAVQLALPFDIAGAPIFYIPLEYFLSAIFVIVIIHEFSHSFVSIAHDIKVKSMGYGFLAFLPLGFAEMDEKKLKKAPSLVKSRVYSAGSFSNIICTILVLILVSLVYAPSGFDYRGLVPDMPSAILPEKGTITQIDNNSIYGDISFYNTLANCVPNQTISITVNDENYMLKLTSNPQNESIPFMGIKRERFSTHMSAKPGIALTLAKAGIAGGFLLWVINSMYMHLFWIWLISFAIALVNILPIKFVLPLDGGFMFEELMKKMTTAKKAARLSYYVSVITLFVILFNFVGPFIMELVPF